MGPSAESGIVILFDDVVDRADEPIAVLFDVNEPVCGLATDPRPHDAAVQIGGVALVEPVLHGVAPIALSLPKPTQRDDTLPEEVVGHIGLEGRRLAVTDVDEDDAGAFLDRVCPQPHALVPDNGRVATVDQGSTQVAVGHVVCPPVVRTGDRAREQALAHREGHAAVEAAVVQGERPALVTDEEEPLATDGQGHRLAADLLREGNGVPVISQALGCGSVARPPLVGVLPARRVLLLAGTAR